MYAARCITHFLFLKMKLNARHATAKAMPAVAKMQKMTVTGRATGITISQGTPSCGLRPPRWWRRWWEIGRSKREHTHTHTHTHTEQIGLPHTFQSMILTGSYKQWTRGPRTGDPRTRGPGTRGPEDPPSTYSL